MNQDMVENLIIETLTEMGICIDVSQRLSTDGVLSPPDIDLRDYVDDSIIFISLIVELERKFGMEFPDELLLIDKWNSLSGFSYLLMEIINNREEEPNEKGIKEAEP